MRQILPGILLALLLTACNTAPKAPTAEQVTEVAAISREVRASPDKADETLKKHGLTAAQFDTLMYDIAKDPAKAAAYREAMK